MELFHRIDFASAKECYEQARIRNVVVNEWEYLVRVSDQDGKLCVKDTRSDVDITLQQQRDSSCGKNTGDDESCSHFSLVVNDDSQACLMFRTPCEYV